MSKSPGDKYDGFIQRMDINLCKGLTARWSYGHNFTIFAITPDMNTCKITIFLGKKLLEGVIDESTSSVLCMEEEENHQCFTDR